MCRHGALILAILLLAGCGVHFAAIHAFDPASPVAHDTTAIVGRVRFVVDGNEMRYSLLTRPAMRLFRSEDNQYYQTPETDRSGAFAWSLPPGTYEIAVLGGGMSPTGEFMYMRDRGTFWQVNGFTYPGFLLKATAGRVTYVGTLVVEVRSRKQRGVIDLTGERVFGSLQEMRVKDESAVEARWQSVQSGPADIGLLQPGSLRQYQNGAELHNGWRHDPADE